MAASWTAAGGTACRRVMCSNWNCGDPTRPLLDLRDELLELGLLVCSGLDLRGGPEHPLADLRPVDHVGQGEDPLLDLGREVEQAHDLGDPGALDALPAGDIGLVGGLARRQEGLPLAGLAEELDHPGRPWDLGRLPVEDPGRNGMDDPVGRHLARQGAEVAVLERPLGPKGDLECLFARGGHGRAVRAVHGEVDDAKPALGLDPYPAASNTGTFGELVPTLSSPTALSGVPVLLELGRDELVLRSAPVLASGRSAPKALG